MGSNKPFRAPVYTSYFEVVKALANQGLLGFYKGYFTGVMHSLTNSYVRFSLLNQLDFELFPAWNRGNEVLKHLLSISTSIF